MTDERREETEETREETREEASTLAYFKRCFRSLTFSSLAANFASSSEICAWASLKRALYFSFDLTASWTASIASSLSATA